MSKGVLLGLVAAVACFTGGLAAARWIGPGEQRAPREPQIVLDTASVQLLPDASLRLDRRALTQPDASAP